VFLLQRFIKDSLQRLAEDGSMKLNTTLRDAALENAKAGRPVPLFAFVVATWFRYLVGVDEQGRAIEIKDPRLPELQPLARAYFGVTDAECNARINGNTGAKKWTLRARTNEPPLTLLETVFGEELTGVDAVTAAVHTACMEIAMTSARSAMINLLI